MSTALAFEKARTDERAALVGYLPAGFPSVDGAIEGLLAMVDAGCDVIEVGLPYSDPVMDGPTIQAAAQRALDAGDPGGATYVAWSYMEGVGIRPDPAKAIAVLRKGAQLGSAFAMRALGHAYYGGRGVEQDYAEALRWYRRASDRGDGEAMYCLAEMYRDGQGVEKDPRQALEWLRLRNVSKIEQHFLPETRIQQVQHGVLGAADVQIDTSGLGTAHPVVFGFFTDKPLIVVRIAKSQVIPARACPLRHYVCFAGGCL